MKYATVKWKRSNPCVYNQHALFSFNVDSVKKNKYLCLWTKTFYMTYITLNIRRNNNTKRNYSHV